MKNERMGIIESIFNIQKTNVGKVLQSSADSLKAHFVYCGGGGSANLSSSHIFKSFTLPDVLKALSIQMNQEKTAFTLAEVLVTLGIIGVVAALTMPSLIANHRKQVVETKLKRTIAVLNEAMKRAQVDYGEANNWENDSSPQVINKYFMPYLAGSAFINESDMTDYKVSVISSSDGSDSMSLNGNYSSGLKLKTGEVIRVVNGVNTENSNALQLGVILQPSKNNKYISGKDYFVYYLNFKKGIVDVQTWGETWGMNCNSSRETMASFCKSSTGHTPVCLMMIECNNYKIPDDYPIKF